MGDRVRAAAAEEGRNSSGFLDVLLVTEMKNGEMVAGNVIGINPRNSHCVGKGSSSRD